MAPPRAGLPPRHPWSSGRCCWLGADPCTGTASTISARSTSPRRYTDRSTPSRREGTIRRLLQRRHPDRPPLRVSCAHSRGRFPCRGKALRGLEAIGAALSCASWHPTWSIDWHIDSSALHNDDNPECRRRRRLVILGSTAVVALVRSRRRNRPRAIAARKSSRAREQGGPEARQRSRPS